MYQMFLNCRVNNKSINEICFSNFDDHYRWATSVAGRFHGDQWVQRQHKVSVLWEKKFPPRMLSEWMWMKKWENTNVETHNMVCSEHQIVLIIQNNILVVWALLLLLYFSILGYHISQWPLNILLYQHHYPIFGRFFLSFVAMLLLHTQTQIVPCIIHVYVCVCLEKRYSVDKQLTYSNIRTYAKWQTPIVTHMNAYAIYHRHRILTEKINTLCHHCRFLSLPLSVHIYGICISETIKSTVLTFVNAQQFPWSFKHIRTHMPNVCTCNITSGNRTEGDIGLLMMEDKSKHKFNMNDEFQCT